ncbi:MAG: hypothetical protein AAFO91_05690, partial [Bacteroidota bacterium]
AVIYTCRGSHFVITWLSNKELYPAIDISLLLWNKVFILATILQYQTATTDAMLRYQVLDDGGRGY